MIIARHWPLQVEKLFASHRKIWRKKYNLTALENKSRLKNEKLNTAYLVVANNVTDGLDR